MKDNAAAGFMTGVASSYTNTNSTSYVEAHSNTNNTPLHISLVHFFYYNGLLDYREYISQTAIYCNDRSIVTGSCYGDNTCKYGGGKRIGTDKSPQYKCLDIIGSQYETLSGTNNNKFTVSTSTGNGKLRYGIATFTADDILFAGGTIGAPNNSYYLMTNTYCYAQWTMTPSYYNASSTYTIGNYLSSFFVTSGGSNGAGTLSSTWSSESYSVRPVLSLKSCVKYAGETEHLLIHTK